MKNGVERDRSVERVRSGIRVGRFAGWVAIVLVCGMLYVGLTPFGAPRNRVAWFTKSNGLRFSSYGTIVSKGEFAPSRDGRSLEIWLEPRATWSGTMILAFYNANAPRFFSVSQEVSDLEVRLQSTIAWKHAAQSRLNVSDVFRRGESRFWAVVCGSDGIVVYRDGLVVRKSSAFRPSGDELSGQLVIGTAPIYSNNWSGTVRGLAIYDRDLTAEQVSRHYRSWAQRPSPEIEAADRCVALYRFDEHSGRVVHNRSGPASDLDIPERYVVLHPTLLDPIWRAFGWTRGFWQDALINYAGFIPAGFFLCAWITARERNRPVLWASLMGGAVSLVIELTQTQLPTRDSSLSDLITNIAGSFTGAAMYRTAIGRTVELGIAQLIERFATRR